MQRRGCSKYISGYNGKTRILCRCVFHRRCITPAAGALLSLRHFAAPSALMMLKMKRSENLVELLLDFSMELVELLLNLNLKMAQ